MSGPLYTMFFVSHPIYITLLVFVAYVCREDEVSGSSDEDDEDTARILRKREDDEKSQGDNE